jgi:hypothetical protein
MVVWRCDLYYTRQKDMLVLQTPGAPYNHVTSQVWMLEGLGMQRNPAISSYTHVVERYLESTSSWSRGADCRPGLHVIAARGI